MTKITYIISDINKAVAFEWIAQAIDRTQFELSFIILNPGASILEDYLRQNSFAVYFVSCKGKKDWPGAILKTRNLLKRIKPDAVHCHMIVSNIVGLIAARLADVKKRIYTRHHSSLHHIYHPKGVWWDKLSNKLATDVVAISGIVKNILINWENVSSSKITLVPHGFKLSVFADVERKDIEAFKQRHNIHNHAPIIGVIARFTKWKGIQYIIPAFKKLLTEYPDGLLLLLNAQGDYEKEIKKDLENISADSYRLIKFEPDIAAAFKTMDVFVHVPIDEHSEAFGQVYVEALAASTPSIFTLSGIAPDFIVDGKNAFVVPFKDSNSIYKKMKESLTNRIKANEIAKQGRLDVRKLFCLDSMIKSLENLYVKK